MKFLLELHKHSPRLPPRKSTPALASDLLSKSCKCRDKQEKESQQRGIESANGRIDKLVYELYGLTEDEIKIVEEK